MKSLNYHDSDEDLSQFNTYVLEWNDQELIWKVNGRQIFYINYSKIDISKFPEQTSPFTKAYYLSLTLQVGGFYFMDQELTADDVRDWNCSAFIVDYVGVYQWQGSAYTRLTNGHFWTSLEENEHGNASSSDICASVMQDIRPTRSVVIEDNQNSSKSVPNLVQLLSLTQLIVWILLCN